jgi:hypothetical protein
VCAAAKRSNMTLHTLSITHISNQARESTENMGVKEGWAAQHAVVICIFIFIDIIYALVSSSVSICLVLILFYVIDT